MVKQMDSKVPKVRFHGFSNEWKEEKLGDKVEFFSGLTYSPNNVQKGVGTLVLRSSNVKNGRIVDADDVYVDSDIVNCKKVEVGDIAVVVRNGSRSLIGKHAQIKKEMENTVIGAFMTGIKSQRPDFITALLDTAQFNSEIAKNLGATINQITTGAFRSMLFYFSEHREEEQIGAYFKELDRLIELHQHKHKKLVVLKQAMLQKMFPQDGATTPEIRFKGFVKDWERKELGEIGETQSGIGFSDVEQGGKSGVPFYKVSDMNNPGNENEMIYANSYVNQEQINRKKWKVVNNVPCVIFAKVGAAVMLNRKRLVHSPFLIDNNMMAYLFDDSWDVFFGKVLFDTVYLPLHAQTGALPSYNGGDIKSIVVKIPQKIEQQKIGNYFRKLDVLISQHAIQLDKLKQIKSACLEKMFV